MTRKNWPPPSEFEEYRLIRALGSGGMGMVYAAHDTLLDRPVAIKFMHHHEDVLARERFVIEARAAARLQHPNVVSVFRIGILETRPYIVSELVRGTSLDQIDKPVDWKQAACWGRDLASGLAAAHRHGILHRDIKSANAILADDGTVKLLDFGLAKIDRAGKTLHTMESAATQPGKDAGAAEVKMPDLPATQELRPAKLGWLSTVAGEQAQAGQPGHQPTLEAMDDSWELAPSSPLADTGVASRPSLEKRWAHTLATESRHLTRAGAVMGTPYYMPPEAWRGEPATARSDVYSLGVVLFELTTGTTPFGHVPHDWLARVVNESDAPGVQDLELNFEPRLAEIIDTCLAREPEKRYTSGEELWNALEELLAPKLTTSVPEGNPYRGLLTFEADHKSLFFGRERDSRTVLERLRTGPCVVVAGDSGVGKSSLCRAGILPRISEDQFAEDRDWSVVTMLPGRRPMDALVSALAVALDVEEHDIADELNFAPETFSRWLRHAQGKQAGTVLFIDQLEELYTLSEPEQAEVFGFLLESLVERTPGVRVLATVRGDYVTRTASLAGLNSVITRHLYILDPMGDANIRDTIVKPAQAAGLEFESEDLVAELLAATKRAANSLPLLQFTLAQLWEMRDADKKCITSHALEQLGGVEGALTRQADQAIARMTDRERKAAKHIFVRLVTLQGTRTRKTAGELVDDDDDSKRAALEALVQGRLLVARQEDGETAYEVAHEALLTHWATLREWLDEASGIRAVLERLSRAAADWDHQERPSDLLWSMRQLGDARVLDNDALAPLERDFIATSRRLARRRTWTRRLAVLVVVVLTAGGYAGSQIKAHHELDARIADHLDEARHALGKARELERQLANTRQSAYAAFDNKDDEQGEALWARAGAQATELHRAYQLAVQPLEFAYRLDPGRDAVQDMLADVGYMRALAAERDRQSLLLQEQLQRLEVLDPEGRWQRRWLAPATLSVRTEPPGARVLMSRYELTADGLLRAQPLGAMGESPGEKSLLPGSYVLDIELPGHVPVKYPVELKRGEGVSLSFPMLSVDKVPDGYLYVPEGRFWFGSADADAIRKWQEAQPIHERRTGGFLIARFETTYADWIAFLEALPPAQRDGYRPRVTRGMFGNMELRELQSGGWELILQPTEHAYTVRSGQRFRYLAREHNIEQDWLRFPVTGVSWQQAAAYVAWLHGTGRVPGARMCREDEWERAARASDGRPFPPGMRLRPSEANFDETYGRKAKAFGPDEVGLHPASRSPVGVDDMVGNALEMVSSVRTPGVVVRGGSYYNGSPSAHTANRYVIQPNQTEPMIGFRVCAEIP